MPIDLPADAVTALPAHLLIHAAGGAGAGDKSFADALQRWCVWWGSVFALRRQSAPTGVHIDDLQGQPFFASEDTRAVIDVPLPAGTYHVNIRSGEVQRRYTVTLEQGITFHLYPRLCTDIDTRRS